MTRHSPSTTTLGGNLSPAAGSQRATGSAVLVLRRNPGFPALQPARRLSPGTSTCKGTQKAQKLKMLAGIQCIRRVRCPISKKFLGHSPLNKLSQPKKKSWKKKEEDAGCHNNGRPQSFQEPDPQVLSHGDPRVVRKIRTRRAAPSPVVPPWEGLVLRPVFGMSAATGRELAHHCIAPPPPPSPAARLLPHSGRREGKNCKTLSA